MKGLLSLRLSGRLLQATPVIIFGVLMIVFGSLSTRFLTLENLCIILVQSSWLIVVALGMNIALLTAGVDLSVGAAMYLAAVTVGLALGRYSPGVSLLGAMAVGALFGAINGLLIVRVGLLAFIVTLATTFIGRGLALFLSGTKIVYASPEVAGLGRTAFWGVPLPLCLAAGATAVVWIIMKRTPFGPYVRSIGADPEGARRVGVPLGMVLWGVYALCGAFAGLGGFVSLSQASSASGAFGLNAEFLAIAAAVLGGTSLFGGRGSVRAPVIGAVLIMAVQNGLAMINANPYAYPVITGAVIFVAALLDSVRLRLARRWERRPIRPIV